MERKISVKKVVLMSCAFAVITVVLVASALSGYSLANKYRRDLENTYKHSLEELSEYLSNMEITLQKGIYANTPTQQHILASKLLTESNSAKTAITALLIPNVQFNNIIKFISQAGDYASYLSTKVSSNQKITSEETENLQHLLSYSKKINENIKNVLSLLEEGDQDIVDLSSKIDSDASQYPEINSGFKELDDVFTDYPTLIYDGPFSDHITRMKPKLLEDKQSLDEPRLKKIAADFLGANQNDLSKDGETNGNLPVTRFKTSNDIEISVTKIGGYVDYMINPRHTSVSTIDQKKALSIAKDFLDKHGYNNMKESYYVTSNGICTINFAYNENDVTFYSDLIKVGIALDSGEVILFESTGYIMNHSKRSFPQDIITQSEAKKSLSPLLTVDESSMAFSPTSGLNEVLCHEFKCHDKDNQQILVYINAQTLLEEKIFIVRNSKNSSIVV